MRSLFLLSLRAWYIYMYPSFHRTHHKMCTLIKTANVHSPLMSHGCRHVSSENITLPDVHYIPGLDINIVSVAKLNELYHLFMFGPNAGCIVVKNKTNELVGKSRAMLGLFPLDDLTIPLDRA